MIITGVDSARHESDIAAYVLTDWAIIEALTHAADRGVAVRLYLDGDDPELQAAYEAAIRHVHGPQS